MTKAILLLVLCQLVYLIPAHLSNDPISVQVDIPLPILSDSKTNPISFEVEIQNDLTSSSIKWGNSYLKSGGIRNSFYRVEAGQKASFLATKNGKGKGSLTDLYPEDEQNTTSGIVTLNIAGKTNSLTLFWEVSSDPDIPNTIGYYWGNQTSNANLYELILNEQLSNSFVKKSYETWTEVDLIGEIKMAFFISDQKEATAKIVLWEEKTSLTEGYYTISWDAGFEKELCLEPLGQYVPFVQWVYCVPNDIKQQWIVHRNASNWYTIRSNSRREWILLGNFYSGKTELSMGNISPGMSSDQLNSFKLTVEKEDGRWRVSTLSKPGYYWTGDFAFALRQNTYTPLSTPAIYLIDYKQRDDSLPNQLFKFELVKFRSDPN